MYEVRERLQPDESAAKEALEMITRMQPAGQDFRQCGEVSATFSAFVL
jgi:hypothetical protein